MKTTVVYSSCISRSNIESIAVEVSISRGLPYYNIVGLADSAIKESRERVRSAIKSCGYSWPDYRLTINLSPAWIYKSGSSFDLAIALGILQVTGQIAENLKLGAWGELSLTAELFTVPKALALTDALLSKDLDIVLVPEAAEPVLSKYIKGLNYVSNLQTAVNICKKFSNSQSLKSPDQQMSLCELEFINQDTLIPEEVLHFPVNLQSKAWRACQIAVAGGHHLLLQGSPGSGKTVLARASEYLLPPLSFREQYDLAKKYSSVGLEFEDSKLNAIVFREPHYSSSKAAMIGGSYKYPLGELALADKGILFMDEINLFSLDVINSMRVASEYGYVDRVIQGQNYRQDARFIMIATANPCKCGLYFENSGCTCSDGDLQRYRGRFRNPFYDRVSLFCNLLSLDKEKLGSSMDDRFNDFQVYREKLIGAREKQKQRYGESDYLLNAWVSLPLFKTNLNINPKAEQLFADLASSFRLSIRSYQNILRVSRTIADLEDSDSVEEKHVYEAFSYRRAEEHE